MALWDYVWLDPTTFGERFSYDARDDVFGKASSPQFVKYHEMGGWLVALQQRYGQPKHYRPSAAVRRFSLLGHP